MNLSVVALVAAIGALIILALANGGDAPARPSRDAVSKPATGGISDQIRAHLRDADAIVDESVRSAERTVSGAYPL